MEKRYGIHVRGIEIGITAIIILLLANGAAAEDYTAGMDDARSPDTLKRPGLLASRGTHFELTDSLYLNITIDSSAPVKLDLESVPEMITMVIESASGAASTKITLGGLTPLTTYHKYEDNYHSHAAFTADAAGKYTYVQDISRQHIIFIQPRHSTKFIRNDATGGDCTAIGTWSAATRTCTLTKDLTETVQIDNNGITLNGNWHKLTGDITGVGVYLPERSGVTVKNLIVTGFSQGIQLYSSSNNVLVNNYAYRNSVTGIKLVSSNNNTLGRNRAMLNYFDGIVLYSSNDNKLIANNASNNELSISRYYHTGIELVYSNNNALNSNTANSNPGYGIYLDSSSNNTINSNIVSQNNAIFFKAYGIYLRSSSNNTIINNYFNNTNNFGVYLYETNTSINKWNISKTLGRSIMGGPYSGGNFWGSPDNTGFSQKCTDANKDLICDAVYALNMYNVDNLPLTVYTAMPPGLAVSLTMNKYMYTRPDDTMNITIRFKNPNAYIVSTYFSWSLSILDPDSFSYVRTVPLMLPPNYDKSVNISRHIGNWSTGSFGAIMHVALHNPTPPHDIFTSKSVNWWYDPSLSLSSGEKAQADIAAGIADEIEKEIKKLQV